MDCVITEKEPKCARCTTGKRTCLFKGRTRYQWYVASSMPTDVEVVEVESKEEEQTRKRRRVGSPGMYFPSFLRHLFCRLTVRICFQRVEEDPIRVRRRAVLRLALAG